MTHSQEPNSSRTEESLQVDVTSPRPRPNARWECGYASLGHPCVKGPSGSGTCAYFELKKTEPSTKGSADVEPYVGEDGSDACEHLVAEYGPCIPKSTAWFSRQTIAINLALLAGGVLLLLMVLPQKEQVFVPGSLSAKHSQILSNTILSDRCSLCHENTHAEMAVGKIQDDLCMNCHASHMPDALAGMAHDLSVEQIATLQSKGAKRVRLVSLQADAQDSVAQTTGSSDAHASGSRTYCAECHVEHRGADHDLKAITDRRCQSCHREQFESFSKGHPEFNHYPYRTQRKIAFDHSVHQTKYFSQKNEDFACSRCHLDYDRSGKVGNVFRSVGFEDACASCHEDSIQSAAMNGWALLQTPCIPTEDQQDASLGLTNWPKAAVFDYDGEVTIAARMLLGSDAQVREALAELPDSGKIARVPRKQRSKVARTLAHGFRRLIRDVAAKGQAAWASRLTSTLEASLGRTINEHELKLIREVSAGLPPDLFRQVDKEWFSGDVLDETHGKNVVLRESAPSSSSTHSDLPFRLVASPDLLLVNSADEDQLLDLLDGESDDQSLSGGLEVTSEPSLSAVSEIGKLTGSQHVSASGWFLDHELLAIRYVPRGHADPILTAWAELVAIVARADGVSGAIIPPGTTPAKILPGGCTECHLVGGRDDPTSTWLNWQASVRPASTKLFTRFDHTPHLTLPTLTDCKFCHILKSEWNESTDEVLTSLKSVYESVTDAEPNGNKIERAAKAAHEFLGDEFLPMAKTQCATCHHSGGANQGCTQCHNYHVGTGGFDWSHAEP